MSFGENPAGIWVPGEYGPAFSAGEVHGMVQAVRQTLQIVYDAAGQRVGVGTGGTVLPFTQENQARGYPVMASLPPLYPEWLGNRSFLEAHGVRFPYVAGAMYRGIASARMVVAMAEAGMLGFLGAAGMPLRELEENLNSIRSAIGDRNLPWGSNLIYMPTEPDLEDAIVDLYFRMGVKRISASAYMAMSTGIIRFATRGLRMDEQGRIHREHHVFAKISRTEVARPFMEPAPQIILDRLLAAGKITAEEARLARLVPVAEDITVEADSGGHTDNRPMTVTLPTVILLRNRMMAEHGFQRPIRVGAAGGIGSPAGVAAAFAMGASYVLTGSINQSAMESGIAPDVKQMLAVAGIADMTMAPAADMFELGVKVQVLKKGTMFSNRAANLYKLYSENDSIDTIPASDRRKLEAEVFKAPLEDIWDLTRNYFEAKKSEEVKKANKDPKYKMALIFRWYLGNSAFWAIAGNEEHRVDYQINCGPSMGAFNAWVKDGFMHDPAERTVVQIALNLLEGAAVVTRAQQLRSYGVVVDEASFDFRPRPLGAATARVA